MTSKAKRLFAASAAVFALGVLAPVSACAEGWMVNGATLTGTAALANTAVVVGGKVVSKGGGVTITCIASSVEGVAPQIESPNKGSNEGMTFTGCAAPAPCSLSTSTIKVLPVVSELSARSEAVVGVIRPKTGTLFNNIMFTTGGTCNFKGKTPVTGEIEVESQSAGEGTWQTATSITTETSGALKIGASGAGIEGSLEFKLANSLPFSFL